MYMSDYNISTIDRNQLNAIFYFNAYSVMCEFLKDHSMLSKGLNNARWLKYPFSGRVRNENALRR